MTTKRSNIYEKLWGSYSISTCQPHQNIEYDKQYKLSVSYKNCRSNNENHS